MIAGPAYYERCFDSNDRDFDNQTYHKRPQNIQVSRPMINFRMRRELPQLPHRRSAACSVATAALTGGAAEAAL
jgi:hypothetical protein